MMEGGPSALLDTTTRDTANVGPSPVDTSGASIHREIRGGNMASKPWKKPYKRAKKRLGGLRKLARAIDTANETQHRQLGLRSRREATVQAGVAKVQALLQDASDRMDKSRTVSREHRLGLMLSVSSLGMTVGGPGGYRAPGLERRKAASLLKELESSVTEILDMLDVADAERSPLYADLRALREAIAKADPALGKKVRLLQLQKWMDRMPSIDLENSTQVRRLARVYVLEQVPDQAWELRHRSTLAGRALVLLAPLADFPTLEILREFDAHLGLGPVYVVAVKRPSWRVVWQTTTHGWDNPYWQMYRPKR